MEDSKDTTGQASTTAAAGSTLISTGIEETITHVDGETDTIVYEGGPEDNYIIAEGDGVGGDITANNITYEISLSGGDGNDTFVAQSGNVIAVGDGGDDTYIWQSGNFLIDQNGVTDSTEHLIVENGNVTLSDFLFFPANLGLGESGANDLLTIVTTGEQITFTDQFQNFNGETTVEKVVIFQINDGPELVFENFDEWVYTFGSDDTLTGQTVFSDGGNDTLTGTSADDILAAGADDDFLDGLIGSDYLDGGQGNDILNFTYEGGQTEDYYMGASGTDTLRVNMTQQEFDTAELRNELFDLQNFIADNGDSETQNGLSFTGTNLGLTAVDFESIEVYVDGNLTEVTPIELAPELTGTTSATGSISEISIEYILDPVPQDFPDLVEGKRLKPDSVINGTNRENLSFDNDHQVDVNFVSESAGYRNALGMYTVSSDGTISNVEFLTENASGAGKGLRGGGSFNEGNLIGDLGTLDAGTEIGFFIVANGYNMNQKFNNIDMDNGGFEFQNDSGTAVNLADHYSDTDLVFVNDDGTIQEIKGSVYHASSSTLNADGTIHAVSGVNEDGKLVIGFEDLKNLGDADFDDLVIELDVADATDTVLDSFEIAGDFTIADEDDNTITEMQIDLSSGEQNGDVLFIDTSLLAGTNISFTQHDDTSFTLSGADSAEAYQAVLQSLSFGSQAEDPAPGTRNVEVSITDEDGLSDSATIEVNINADSLELADVLQEPDALAVMFEADDQTGGTEGGMAPVEYDTGLNIDDLSASAGGEVM